MAAALRVRQQFHRVRLELSVKEARMYELFVEVSHFRQILKVQAAAAHAIRQDCHGFAQKYGAKIREVASGEWILSFEVRRPRDSVYILEGAFELHGLIDARLHDECGFSLLLEALEGQDEPERILKKLWLRTNKDGALWIGPNASGALGAYLNLEEGGGVARAISMKPQAVDAIKLRRELLEGFGDIDTIVAGLRPLTKGRDTAYCAVLASRENVAGELVNAAVGTLLGADRHRDFLWICAFHENEAAPVALTRCFHSFEEARLYEVLDENERRQWDQNKSSLFQNGNSAIQNIQPANAPIEFPEAAFGLMWRIFLKAFLRAYSRAGSKAIVHVEHYERLSESARELLQSTLCDAQFMKEFQALVIFTGDEREEWPELVLDGTTIELADLDLETLRVRGFELDKFLAGLSGKSLTGSISRRGAVYAKYLAQWGKLPELDERNSLQSSRFFKELLVGLFRSMDEVQQNLAFIITIMNGFLPLAALFELMADMGIERVRHPHLIQELHNLDWIRDEELIFPQRSDIIEMLEEVLGDRASELHKICEQFLEKALEAGDIPLRYDTFTLVGEIGSTRIFVKMCFRYGELLLDVEDVRTVDRIIEYALNRIRNDTDQDQKQRLYYFVTYLNGRSLLMQRRFRELAAATNQLNQLSTESYPEALSWYELQRARYWYAQNEREDAASAAKRSVIAFQEHSDLRGLSSAQILFGQVLLGKERLIEARDYFMLARNNATSCSAAFQDVRAGCYDIVVSFYLGYHTRGLNAILEPEGIMRQAGMNGFFSHVAFLHFVRTRIWFELGDYQEALGAVGAFADLAGTYHIEEAASLAARWKARILYHLGSFKEAESILLAAEPCQESSCFLAEMKVLQGNFDEAVEILGGAPTHRENSMLYPEGIDWTDGFANLEDKVLLPFCKQGVLSNLVNALVMFSGSQTGKGDEGADWFYGFVRNKLRPQSDPLNFLYHFWYAQVLGAASQANSDDRVTILGKSIKFFQERASRIEDPGQKQVFMKRAYWNEKLLGVAKFHNLA